MGTPRHVLLLLLLLLLEPGAQLGELFCLYHVGYAAGLSSALGSSRHINTCSAVEERLCDFVCDCPEDCSDEEDCGYDSDPPFICDFEKDTCGWTHQNVHSYKWGRQRGYDSDPPFICDFEKDTCGWTHQNVHSYKWGRQRGYISGDSASDHTLGTDRGWFMAVGAVHDNILTTAVLVSPRMRQAAPACELRFWYQVWDSGRVGVDAGSLFATLRSSSREAMVWRGAGSSMRGWREASIFTGRVPESFQIVFMSRRSLSYPGDIAIDDINFRNCALPQPGSACSDQFLCARGTCVETLQTCDGTDDCGDSSDEDADLCGSATSRMGPVIGLIANGKGPIRCRSAHLTCCQALPEITLRTPMQIVIEGVLGGGRFGNIALDDLILSPGCRISNDSLSPDWELPTAAPSRCNQGQFECRNGRCVDQNLVCDFRLDCSDQSDEMDCGNATFDVSDGGWRDHSAGRLEWTVRQNTSSSHGGHLSLSRAHGQLLSKAKALSPVLGPSGPACSMQFRYLLYSNSTFTGGISVSSVDQALGTEVLLWRTHRTQDKWTSVTVSVGARPRGFQIEIAALVDNFVPRVQKVAVDDVAFLNCTPDLEPPTAADVSCNFEAGLCGWYQDQTDELEWIHDIGPGFDHTTGSGHFVFVDVSSPDLRGRSARLLSYPQRSSVETMCLSFWYHLFGPHTGTLSLKLRLGGGDEETVLWTRSGTQGNEWQRGLSPVHHQNRTFEIIFQAVGAAGTSSHIAVDDITFQAGSCSRAGFCDFERGLCSWTNTQSQALDQLDWDWTSAGTTGKYPGPGLDHTLKTRTGHYVFLSSRSRAGPGQKAWLLSEHLPATQGSCLGLWYHLDSAIPIPVEALLS
ncbi:UNVERIFIED_CONTAM: hypothetical protein FKN15_044115 [Acipenser sinensis]